MFTGYSIHVSYSFFFLTVQKVCIGNLLNNTICHRLNLYWTSITHLSLVREELPLSGFSRVQWDVDKDNDCFNNFARSIGCHYSLTRHRLNHSKRRLGPRRLNSKEWEAKLGRGKTRVSQRRLDLRQKQWGVSKGFELQSDRVRFVF